MQLSGGDKGIEETVDLMQMFLDKYSNNSSIKNILNKNNLIGISKSDTIKRIFTYFAHHYTYKPDPKDIELVKSPKHTIIGNEKYGDCDDLSLALATFLRNAGIKTKFRTVAWKPNNGNNFTHIYVMAYDGFKWIALDPSAGISGYQKEVDYFRKKDW